MYVAFVVHFEVVIFVFFVEQLNGSCCVCRFTTSALVFQSQKTRPSHLSFGRRAGVYIRVHPEIMSDLQ